MDTQLDIKNAGASTVIKPVQAERLWLEIDGQPIGSIQAKDGGGISAEVIDEPVGPDFFVHKHIAGVKYEDVTINTGLTLDSKLYTWIAEAWSDRLTRRDVSILTLDPQDNIRWQEDYFNVLISETGIPTMDASSKQPAYLSVKFSPEYARWKKGSGKPAIPQTKATQKKWLASNFRLEIDKLDCTKVNKIESFTVKQGILQDEVGEQREYERQPGKLDFPNLQISLAESAAQSWLDWHDNFVIKGNNDSAHEKNGTLTFLSPDLKTVLGSVHFFGIGIFRLTPDKVEAGSENIRRVKAELYVDRMEFEHK